MNFTAVVESGNMTHLYYEIPSIIEKRNQGKFPTTNLDTVSSVIGAIFLRLIYDVCFIEETARRR